MPVEEGARVVHPEGGVDVHVDEVVEHAHRAGSDAGLELGRLLLEALDGGDEVSSLRLGEGSPVIRVSVGP